MTEQINEAPWWIGVLSEDYGKKGDEMLRAYYEKGYNGPVVAPPGWEHAVQKFLILKNSTGSKIFEKDPERIDRLVRETMQCIDELDI